MTIGLKEWIIPVARRRDLSAVSTLLSIAEEGVGVEAKVALDVLAYLGRDAAPAAISLAAVASRALDDGRPRYAGQVARALGRIGVITPEVVLSVARVARGRPGCGRPRRLGRDALPRLAERARLGGDPAEARILLETMAAWPNSCNAEVVRRALGGHERSAGHRRC